MSGNTTLFLGTIFPVIKEKIASGNFTVCRMMKQDQGKLNAKPQPIDYQGWGKMNRILAVEVDGVAWYLTWISLDDSIPRFAFVQINGFSLFDYPFPRNCKTDSCDWTPAVVEAAAQGSDFARRLLMLQAGFAEASTIEAKLRVIASEWPRLYKDIIAKAKTFNDHWPGAETAFCGWEIPGNVNVGRAAVIRPCLPIWFLCLPVYYIAAPLNFLAHWADRIVTINPTMEGFGKIPYVEIGLAFIGYDADLALLCMMDYDRFTSIMVQFRTGQHERELAEAKAQRMKMLKVALIAVSTVGGMAAGAALGLAATGWMGIADIATSGVRLVIQNCSADKMAEMITAARAELARDRAAAAFHTSLTVSDEEQSITVLGDETIGKGPNSLVLDQTKPLGQDDNNRSLVALAGLTIAVLAGT